MVMIVLNICIAAWQAKTALRGLSGQRCHHNMSTPLFLHVEKWSSEKVSVLNSVCSSPLPTLPEKRQKCNQVSNTQSLGFERSYGTCCRGEWYSIFFLLYRCVLGFAAPRPGLVGWFMARQLDPPNVPRSRQLYQGFNQALLREPKVHKLLIRPHFRRVIFGWSEVD